MVLVSHKYKFIYIKNTKVAGSSVEAFFGQFCINPLKKYNFGDKTNEKIDKFGIIGSRVGGVGNKWIAHKTAKQIRNDLGHKMFYKYFKFCVIRNPYDKMVSKYFFMKSKLPFKYFAKIENVGNLRYHSINGKSECNFYIRYENLEEDIIKVCKILNIQNYDINDLPKHKSEFRKKDIHYREYYDDETREIVYKNHKKEFDMFGYEF